MEKIKFFLIGDGGLFYESPNKYGYHVFIVYALRIRAGRLKHDCTKIRLFKKPIITFLGLEILGHETPNGRARAGGHIFLIVVKFL